MVSWHSDGADSYFLWTNSYVLWAIQRLPSREEDFTSLLDIISFPSIHWYFSSLQSVSFLNGAPINWWVHIPSLLYQVSPCLFTLFVNSVFLSPCNFFKSVSLFCSSNIPPHVIYWHIQMFFVCLVGNVSNMSATHPNVADFGWTSASVLTKKWPQHKNICQWFLTLHP